MVDPSHQWVTPLPMGVAKCKCLFASAVVLCKCRASSHDSGAPQTLGANTVGLKLTCVAGAAGVKMGTQTRKVPMTMTVGTLKALVRTLFSLKGNVKLFLRDETMPVPEALEDDERLQLKYLDLKVWQQEQHEEMSIQGCHLT